MRLRRRSRAYAGSWRGSTARSWLGGAIHVFGVGRGAGAVLTRARYVAGRLTGASCAYHLGRIDKAEFSLRFWRYGRSFGFEAAAGDAGRAEHVGAAARTSVDGAGERSSRLGWMGDARVHPA